MQAKLPLLMFCIHGGKRGHATPTPKRQGASRSRLPAFSPSPRSHPQFHECMLRFVRNFGIYNMAKAPLKPLITIVGATGTGKSDVFAHIIESYQTQLITPGSWQLILLESSMARLSTEMLCSCIAGCRSSPTRSRPRRQRACLTIF